jgi:hypothetical protein
MVVRTPKTGKTARTVVTFDEKREASSVVPVRDACASATQGSHAKATHAKNHPAHRPSRRSFMVTPPEACPGTHACRCETLASMTGRLSMGPPRAARPSGRGSRDVPR